MDDLHAPHSHPSPHSGHAEERAARGAPMHEHAGGTGHAHMVADFRRRFFVTLALTIPILALSADFWALFGLRQPVSVAGQDYVLFVLGSVAYVYGGWPFLTGLLAETQKRQPGMMTLIGVAISAAYFFSTAVALGLVLGMGFYWELATLLDVMLLGHWIEMRSVLGASGALEALVKLLPAEAHRVNADGTTKDVAIIELVVGDRILIKPGEKVPTDGVIISGRTSMNEAMLTGESRPIEKREGDSATGGAVNGEGAITVEVRKTGDQTYLAQVIEMVRQAQASRSRTQDVANRAASWLTFIALAGGAITVTVWLALARDAAFALERAVTVMVIACPHALGLAVPLVVAVSTTLSARRGLLIRDRTAFEQARNLQAVVFDKTGTLTEGRFGVTDIVMLANRDEPSCLRLAAALESQSEHPIAQGIIRAASERNLPLPAITDFRALAGRGAQASIDGKTYQVVSPGYMREHDLVVRNAQLDTIAEQGKTVVYLLEEKHALAAFALADLVRPVSREAIRQLKAMGLRCMMLTGDAQAVARTVANELGLDEYFAEVLPEQKAHKIEELKQRGLTVAMVGDGVNDAPALVAADLGIAIGAGTDVAVESADVVLVRNDPRDVVAILGLSRATYRKMVQNLWWATGYNAVAIPLAAGVAAAWGILLQPAVGALLMTASTVIVAINAQLLSRNVAPS